MFRSIAISGCAALIAAVGTAQEAAPLDAGIRATAEQLMQAGLSDDVGLQFTEDLTTEIGPRLAGSEAEARSRDWAVQEIQSLGFENIRIEHFTIPFWSRVSESATVIEPNPQPFVITALGGSPSTPASGIEADVIRFENLMDLQAADPGEVQGRIVFIDERMTRTMDGSGYGPAVQKRRSCAQFTADKGGLGCLIRSVGTQHHRIAHTGMMARGEAVGPAPAAALSPPDADQLARLLERGPVRLNLNIQVETAPSAPSGNVIGEVPGTDLADEIVLVGCHLDTWDVSPGATDDAAGCGIVVGAAKLIMESGVEIRRTIRVVLYGAEEVGLLGGNAYAEAHAGDLLNHVLAAESDGGAGPVWRFETNFGDGAMGYARTLQHLLQPLGVLRGDNNAPGGPDIRVLQRAGVPVVTPRQDATFAFDYHHTSDDTFDKIVPDEFRQNVAVYAGFAYVAAATDWDFRRDAGEASASD